jgi:fermentation-respiration switch protein FrsA (DUF1100 family)
MNGWMGVGILVVGVFCIAGCITAAPHVTYQITPLDRLSLSVPEPTIREEVLSQQEGITLSRVSFEHIDETVYLLLVVPESPRIAIVFAPGAGVKKEAHQARAETFARSGIAMAVLDVRGNGGETAGTPLDIEGDLRRFTDGSWPQYYAIVADMIATREFLASRYAVPVYAMGSSNGGRYAAIAATADGKFSGYIGISTSGFGLAGNRYSGQTRKFLLSIDPDHAIADISPRPVLLFHAPDDPILPYADGRELFGRAQEPKEFRNLSTGHGLNGEADQEIIEYLLNFNVPERQ